MSDPGPGDIARLFTREEFRAAMGLLFPDGDEADLLTRLVYESAGVSADLADGSLLALALVSEDAARRVVAYRPSLEEMVRRTRADPEGARASLRPAPPPGPGEAA